MVNTRVRLIIFFAAKDGEENALVIANTLPTTQEKTLNMDISKWSIPKSD